MFLSRPNILEHMRAEELRFDPPIAEDRVAQVSIDLLLGERFTVFKEEFPEHISSIRMAPSLWQSGIYGKIGMGNPSSCSLVGLFWRRH